MNLFIKSHDGITQPFQVILFQFLWAQFTIPEIKESSFSSKLSSPCNFKASDYGHLTPRNYLMLLQKYVYQKV